MHAFASSQSAHRGQRRSKALVAACLVMALLFSTGGIAEAQTDRVRSQQVDQVRPAPVIETLRLACSPDFVNGQRGVLCEWSEANNPHTRAYKLFRIANGLPRELIATVGVDGRLGHFDTDITAPSSLVYGVISVNRNGRLTGRSAPVHVQYGQDIEQLRMACAPDFVDGERGVLCRWSESSQPGICGYLVYRIAGSDQREVVARVGLDERNAYFDTDVVPGATLTYGVTAVAGDGTVVGIGGPQQVTWPVAD